MQSDFTIFGNGELIMRGKVIFSIVYEEDFYEVSSTRNMEIYIWQDRRIYTSENEKG